MPQPATDVEPPALRLAVLNELAAIEPARLRVLEFVAGHELPARLLFKLELVLEETLMNRLQHAFAGDGHHITDVHLRIAPDELVFCFEDDGIPFDPQQAPTPQQATSIQDAAPGGRGLVLIRKAASACQYERVDGRNRFTVRLARE